MHRSILRKIVFGWLLLAVLVALFGRITIAAPDAGRTAADFLLIGTDASSAGMGGAFTAASEGATAAYWNPAGLASLEQGEVLLSHLAWYQDIKLEHGAVAFRVRERLTLAAAITYLSYGRIEGYDAYGYANGYISAYDWAGAVSAGYQLSHDLSCGLTAKFINQQFDDIGGSTFATDVGFKYRWGRFVIAGAVTNLGPAMKFESVSEKLPTAERLSLYATPFDLSVAGALEIEKRNHGGFVIRNGYEMTFYDQYFIRTGYNYLPDEQDRHFGAGLTMGAGVKFERLEFDYAFTPGDSYSSDGLHRISVLFKLSR
jgi:hypothetical protein